MLLCSTAVFAGDKEEIADLKKRVAELEEQNRRILQLLEEMKPTATASVAQSSRTSVPTTPQPAAALPETKPASAHTREGVSIGEGNYLKFYGWLRMDADIDSQRPNAGETPLFINAPGPQGNDQGLLSLHPRLTRLGMDFNGPEIDSLGGAALSGKLETDFENGGTESRQIIRIRLAYFQLKWNDFSILGGQAWDVFSPLAPTVNNDTLMWDAGNLGDRRPQFQADWEPKMGKGFWSVTTAAGFTGAIDGLADSSGYLYGQESALPDVQARLGYSYPVLGRNLAIGISTFSGWENATVPIAGRTGFRAQGQNIDYTVPLQSRISLRGEGWWGRNLSDVRGGAGQGINTVTGREIRGRGGWSEFTIQLTRKWSIHPGFTTDDPVAADVPIGGRTRNGAYYFGNRFNPNPAFTIGADYLRWTTDYKGLAPGIDNRVNLFFYYAF